MTDIDLEHYNYQEAEGLRKQGWRIRPPNGGSSCPGPRCLTMTPGGRLCRYCARSASIARAAA